MKSIAILIDNRERFEFFKRRVLGNTESKFIFLHSNLFSFYLAKSNYFGNNIEHILLKSDGSNTVVNCVEYHKGNFVRFPKVDTSHLKNTLFDELWLFNGYQSVALQLKESLSFNNTRYYEIGNFPNKYQSNEHGINASSKYDVSSFRSDWNENSLLDLIEYIPPHTKKKIKTSVVEFGFNFLGGRFFKTVAPVSGLLRTLVHAVNFKLCKREFRKYQDVALPEKYHLFVGQVNADTQIVFQSDENNLSAIKKWHQDHKGSKIPLLYRFHPSERDLHVVKNIIKFCLVNDILISNRGSIIQSLRNASSVSMINSTSGIYALLINKKVTCYGRSIFSEWKPEYAQTYVSAILKNDVE
ncbi:capsular polysaccharide export protein, LipB/KpsS family [Pseudopelagicola sp. nBUS_19]|uniref:capsular polysaccharide export protein, LipB/KpsS family n=1 Tax=Pseudopelagicola sp. nBUS_19 TaxID=3395316 RepID=UPI003EBD7AEB